MTAITLTPKQQSEARQRRVDGAFIRELSESYNVGKSTIARLSRGQLKMRGCFPLSAE